MSVKTLHNIDKTIDKYFENFIEEDINGIKCKTLVSKDKKPIIKQFGYDKNTDRFEIVFRYSNSEQTIPKKKDNIVFIENSNGELMAIQIHNFKKQQISKIKLAVNMSITNEIQELSMELIVKDNDISNGLIEKRKLQLLNDIIKNNLDEMSRNNIASVIKP